MPRVLWPEKRRIDIAAQRNPRYTVGLLNVVSPPSAASILVGIGCRDPAVKRDSYEAVHLDAI
jgi:hypothetical protein